MFSVQIGIFRVASTQHGSCNICISAAPADYVRGTQQGSCTAKTTTANTPYCGMTEVYLYLRIFPKFRVPFGVLPKNSGAGVRVRERDYTVKNIQSKQLLH